MHDMQTITRKENDEMRNAFRSRQTGTSQRFSMIQSSEEGKTIPVVLALTASCDRVSQLQIVVRVYVNLRCIGLFDKNDPRFRHD